MNVSGSTFTDIVMNQVLGGVTTLGVSVGQMEGTAAANQYGFAFNPFSPGEFIAQFSSTNPYSCFFVKGTITEVGGVPQITSETPVQFQAEGSNSLDGPHFDYVKPGQWTSAYHTNGNSQYGTVCFGQLGSPPVENLTSSNFIGMSNGLYVDGATSSVTLKGGVSTNQTGLAVGSTYYVQPDGTIAASAGTPSVEAGLAISSTSLLLTSEAGATGADGADGADGATGATGAAGADGVDAVAGSMTHFHSAIQDVTNASTLTYTFSELTNAIHYQVFLNRLVLRPTEYSVSGTTVTLVAGTHDISDELEVTGFSLA